MARTYVLVEVCEHCDVSHVWFCDQFSYLFARRLRLRLTYFHYSTNYKVYYMFTLLVQ